MLCRLAGELGVDEVTVDGQQQSQTALIDERARALAAAPPDTAAVATAWKTLSASIYDLDAHAQDTLAARSEMQAAAYQFGRGLAEVYWALDPDAACEPTVPDCWTFLLGEHRCAELTRLAGRLSAHFNPYSAQALLTRLRQDAYTDLVAVAIAQAPDKPGARRPRKVVAEEVRKRTLTTTVGATVP